MNKSTNEDLNHQQGRETSTPSRIMFCCLCFPLERRRRRTPIAAEDEIVPSPPHIEVPTLSSRFLAQPLTREYVENREQCVRNLLRRNGHPSKVLLFPEEGWARSASSSYWIITPVWWNRSRCKVVEVAGTRRYSTHAKMMDNGSGTLFILGSFKRQTIDSDFKLHLTSNVSISDFNMGYCMTGSLERGSRENNSFQMTHFAVIRRKDYDLSN